MFYCHTFITNSSSTSFIAVGVSLHRDRAESIFKHLVKSCSAEELLDRYNRNYGRANKENFLKDPESYILRELSGILGALGTCLPEGVYLECPPYDLFYMCIGYPGFYLTADGIVVLEDPEELKKGFHNLKKLLTELGINDHIDVVSDGV